ncbi:hypothetical protein O997_04090 [Anaplasma phagocytophilum str. MRK]|nr:hypothetical protein O997_04090 [Anaplasma phagocytophilum str. MRK]
MVISCYGFQLGFCSDIRAFFAKVYVQELGRNLLPLANLRISLECKRVFARSFMRFFSYKTFRKLTYILCVKTSSKEYVTDIAVEVLTFYG